MDRRTLLFFAVSAAILLLYQEFVLNRMMPPAGQPAAPVAQLSPRPQAVQPPIREQTQLAEVLPVDEGEAPGTASPTVEALKGRSIVVETSLYRAAISTVGGRLESYELKDFRETTAPDSAALNLIVEAPEVELPLGIELRGARVWSDARTVYTASHDKLSVEDGEAKTLILRASLGGQKLEKRLTFEGNRYIIGLETRVPGAASLPASLSQDGPDGSLPSVALLLTRGAKPDEDGTIYEGAAALVGESFDVFLREEIETPETLRGTVGWAGFVDHYFLAAAAPTRADAVKIQRRGTAIQTKIVSARNTTGGTDIGYTLYLGPKERTLLEEAGHEFERGLNLGWFGPIALLLLDLLQLLHLVSGNWGVDIVLLTVVVKIVFWPLTKKSFDSMRAMQKLQPEMQKIKEKFSDDQQKQSQETMALYKRHGVNPLGGCLPMLLQMPVFFGLYQLLSNTIELRHAPFALWITDLSVPERLYIAGFGVPVLSILMGASMFIQQKMTPTTGDPTQQKIMMFMPLIFTFMFINFPAGLTLYWLTQNILTIAQQWLQLRSKEP